MKNEIMIKINMIEMNHQKIKQEIEVKTEEQKERY